MNIRENLHISNTAPVKWTGPLIVVVIERGIHGCIFIVVIFIVIVMVFSDDKGNLFILSHPGSEQKAAVEKGPPKAKVGCKRIAV